MDAKKPVTALVLLLLSGAASLNAQSVSGVASDAAAGTPLRSALVTLRNNATHLTRRLLTDSAGRFSIRADTGDYRVSVEYIGYDDVARDITVRDGDDVFLKLQLQPRPVQLSGLEVKESGKCGSIRDPHAARLWYLAKTALGAASVERTRRMQIRTFERETKYPGGRVVNERSESAIMTSLHGFQAEPRDSVATKGFVQERGTYTFYFAPDPDVLLSDDFAQQHCFRITRDRSGDGLVGLSFTPRRVERASIQGTVWLERNSGLLRYLEFTYVGLAAEPSADYAGGRIDFRPLPDGAWVIPRWSVRMPRMQLANTRVVSPLASVMQSSLKRRARVTGVVERGGEILSELDDSGPQLGRIEGMVFDSMTGEALAGATINVAGTQYSTTTDADGRYALADIPLGDYTIEFDHPVLQNRPRFARGKALTVQQNTSTRVDLIAPNAATVRGLYCSDAQMRQAAQMQNVHESQLGVITGVAPMSKQVVHARWRTYYERGGSVRENTLELEAVIDREGRFAFCGVPSDHDVDLFVGESETAVSRVRLVPLRGNLQYVDLLER